MSVFYWQHARDNVLTVTGIQIFQLACNYDGCDVDTAKKQIDEDYAKLTRIVPKKHGGLFGTQLAAYIEAGWLKVDDAGKLRITDAGKQIQVLLSKAPDFLKAIPYFIVELLARYQLNNPAKPLQKGEVKDEIKKSDIFPYWTIWKIMRSCDNCLSSDEMRRFLLQLQKSEDIEECIQSIKAYRHDKDSGMTVEELDQKYPKALTGALGEMKYIMPRAGMHIGKQPSLMYKPDYATYCLDEAYLPFIDEVLANEPVFKDYITANTWMEDYGQAVSVQTEYLEFASHSGKTNSQLADSDEVYQEIKALIDIDGANAFMLSGPPGTSKSWYARQIAYKLVDGDEDRVKLIQFHPSFGYEDFVEGYVPQENKGGVPSFELLPKVFSLACQQVLKSGKSVVLIIDEFTRGDAGRIFGEILTYIEQDYRNQVFTLASGKPFLVPNDLYIIATMNPYDRSVTDIDVALERRFEIIPLEPSEAILRQFLLNNKMDAAVTEKVVEFFNYCQDKMPFGGLGHVFFYRAKDAASLRRIWSHKLEPMFKRLFRFEQDTFDSLKATFDSVIRFAASVESAPQGTEAADGSSQATATPEPNNSTASDDTGLIPSLARPESQEGQNDAPKQPDTEAATSVLPQKGE